jgi:hypothetical protein
MRLDDLKEKKELMTIALLSVSVVSAVLIVVKVTGSLGASAKAEEMVRQAIDCSEPDAKNLTAQLGKFKKDADALKKQNLFSPPQPRQNPVKAVLGIFGDEALINGRWYKAGSKVADAKILAVGPTSVTVEWDGETKVFSPIDAGSSSGPSGPSRSGSLATSRGASSTKTGLPQMVVTKSASGMKPPAADDPMLKKMSQTYENMSDSQKEKFKKAMAKSAERYGQMSSEEKTRFKAQMIKKISGNGGPIRIELKAK